MTPLPGAFSTGATGDTGATGAAGPAGPARSTDSADPRVDSAAVRLTRKHRGGGAALATAVLPALALSACGSSGTTTTGASTSTGSAPKPAIPVAATPGKLRSIAGAAGHPIYWAGTFNGTYELTTIGDGRTYVRYLPTGTPVGSANHYLTIGTYMLSSPPFASVQTAAAKKHAVVVKLKGGALAVQYKTRPESVYLVFPGASYEVEVYDPSAATALKDATTGKVVPIT